MSTTPAQALQAVADARSAAERVIAATTPEEAQAAFQALHDAMHAIDAKQPAEPDSTEWQGVADAMDQLVGWLQGTAEETAKRVLTRDEKIKIAVGLARRGRRSRRLDPAEAIISTFEAGLVGLVKLTYHTLRLTVIGIAAVSHAAVHGAIHVAQHYRNGRLVRAYDRERRQSDPAAGAKKSGAQRLYYG